MKLFNKAVPVVVGVMGVAANAAATTIDTTDMTAQITACIAGVVAIGGAVMGVYFIAKSFGWIKSAAK
jgi:hypothetical protein